jgi:hypothetical protein
VVNQKIPNLMSNENSESQNQGRVYFNGSSALLFGKGFTASE